MDKDRVKGAVDDVVGRAKRQIGEWTGDADAQIEGAAQQIKGKAEKAFGAAKETLRDVEEKAKEELEKRKKPEAEHPVASGEKKQGAA